MKRNTLTTAVLAGLTGMAGMVSVSNAVNVNPDGLGQVLLYPYYTARGGNDTLISVVNTTSQGKAVKVRFIEALNSREVLDFNVYMSPYDVWTAAITPEGDGAKMRTFDTTCTAPQFFDPEEGVGEQVFLDNAFSGDGGPSGLERTASGYLEVIEMGALLPQTAQSTDPSNPGYVPYAAKHVDGVPRDCAYLENLWVPDAPPATPGGAGWWEQDNETWGLDTELGATGGLFGSGSIVNFEAGTMFSYNATAIDGFWLAGEGNHTDPSQLLPNLSDSANAISNVFVNGSVQTHDWTGGLAGTEAVNATLTYEMLMNEYNLDTLAGEPFARSEWVVTFPTKRAHTDAAPGGAGVTPGDALPPFTDTWHIRGDGSLNVPCEALSFRVWDREENEPSPDTGVVIPSPPPEDPAPDVFELCREANVIRFTGDDSIPDQTEILGETLRAGGFASLSYTNFEVPGFESGWFQFDFANIPSAAGGGQRLSAPGVNAGTGAVESVAGLPVIGFFANTFTTGEGAGGILANYGGTFTHRGSRSIVPAGD